MLCIVFEVHLAVNVCFLLTQPSQKDNHKFAQIALILKRIHFFTREDPWFISDLRPCVFLLRPRIYSQSNK